MADMLRGLMARLSGGRAAPAPLPPAAAPPAAPGAAEWRARGNQALGQGDLAQARDCYRQAVAADPEDPLARLNLGFAQLELGALGEAAQALGQALALRRDADDFAHEAHFLLGRARQLQGAADAALASYEAAHAARADFAEPIVEAARLLQELGRDEAVLPWALRLRQARPSDDAEVLVARALAALGRHAEALAVLDAVLQREPRHAGAWTGRGSVLLALQRGDEALAALEHAIDLLGAEAEPLTNLATALSHLGRHEEALLRLEQVLQRFPDHRDAWLNRVLELLQLLRVREAVGVARAALARYPADADLHWALAVAHLLQGEFEQGWEEHEWRWQAKANTSKAPPPDFGKPRWAGEDLGRSAILLFAEQGLGDTIQFLRFVPVLAARARKVLVEVPQSVYPLARTMALPPNCEWVPSGAPLPAFDFQCPLLSLPQALGLHEGDLPRPVPYFQVDPARAHAWRQRVDDGSGRLRVGIVWSGNPRHKNDHNRSIALAAMRGLAQDGVQLVSLQPEVRACDRPAMDEWPQLLRLGEELRDFVDTAALLDALDLVISVDTSVAHLAGALGKPVWILLPYCPDWRWMLDREDSPWYPTARLYRQPRSGDWAAVLERVRDELGALIPGPGAAGRSGEVAPQPALAHLEQARLLQDKGRLDEALAQARRAAQLDPAGADFALLAALCSALGFGEEALDASRRAVQADPTSVHARSRQLFYANFAESARVEQVFEAHREFGRMLEAAVPASYEGRWRGDRDPGRRLRLGFVSADFHHHPVAMFLIPLLQRLDRGGFEVYAYSGAAQADEATRLLRAASTAWVDVSALPSADLARRVHQDAIDILIDLSGHSGTPRLSAFAQKPAPVQMTWLGYLNTTGLRRIDYRLCDERTDPPATQRFHTERLLPFSASQWCYRPFLKVEDARAAPCAINGRITFGSFNNARKISDAMCRRWARLLGACPGSRLLLADISSATRRAAIQAAFDAEGVAPERIQFEPRADLAGYYGLYSRVDISLDTYPYGGGTTTLDSLWMGVPVVTAAGDLPVSRSASSILALLGLDGWVAESIDGYVDCALRNAADPAAVQRLRASLRQRLLASPLMDEQRFATDFQQAMRAAWTRHCAEG